MCERCRREFNSMYSSTPVYYEKNKGWNDYVYKGVRGLKKISLEYKVPLSLLIARMKKGWSLHESVTYASVNMSEVIAKITTPLPKALPATTEKKALYDNGFGTYSVKIHQNGQPLPFPDKMDALWRLALGLPSLQ